MSKDNEVVRNADYEIFLTNGAHGYLEHAGTALGHHVRADAQRGDMERCHRMEVRETRSGFEIQKASFERAVDWTEWRETGRERQGVYQNREEAVQAVKSAEKEYGRQLVAEFRAAVEAVATIETERSNDGENKQMNNELLRAGYDAQQLRIEQLEGWIQQSITRPSMSRELRLQGLELIEARSPEIRLAVERICPSRSHGLEQTLEIER
jgi:hypothetical protein